MKQNTEQSMTGRGFPSLVDQQLERVRDVAEWYEQNFKMVPNLVRAMAASPALLRSYWQTQQYLKELGNLSPIENNVVQMAIARANGCRYCISGHYLAGKVFFGTPEDVMQQVSAGTGISDQKLEALRTFALRVYATQGRVTDAELNAFLEAGYTRAQALDVVANVAVKVMTNYTNQLVGTELDPALQPFAATLHF